MKAVFLHEISSLFTNVTGYVFAAFLLLFAGIYTMIYNLNAGLANFEYVLGNMAFIFLIIVPVLTMRMIAEERRQKTDQLLYSLPLRMTQVVLGKYLSMLVLFLIPLCIIALYPIVLSSFGNLYLPAAFSALVGFFFLGAALLSIGLFISSLTESQAIAAGLCFAVMLVNYFISDLSSYVSSSATASYIALAAAAFIVGLIFRLMTKNNFATLVFIIFLEVVLLVFFVAGSSHFSGLFGSIIEQLSLFERFYVLIYGVFDLTSIVYFLSVIAVFLFLTVQSLEKRRWSE